MFIVQVSPNVVDPFMEVMYVFLEVMEASMEVEKRRRTRDAGTKKATFHGRSESSRGDSVNKGRATLGDFVGGPWFSAAESPSWKQWLPVPCISNQTGFVYSLDICLAMELYARLRQQYISWSTFNRDTGVNFGSRICDIANNVSLVHACRLPCCFFPLHPSISPSATAQRDRRFGVPSGVRGFSFEDGNRQRRHRFPPFQRLHSHYNLLQQPYLKHSGPASETLRAGVHLRCLEEPRPEPELR